MLEIIGDHEKIDQCVVVSDQVVPKSKCIVYKCVCIADINEARDDPSVVADGKGTYVHLYKGQRVHAVWCKGQIVDLVIDTTEGLHPQASVLFPVDTVLRCYQCDVKTTWLAPDGRCGQCTRYTPEEVRGDKWWM